MYCIEISEGITSIISLFYCIGLWHRGDTVTPSETRIKWFYCFYYLLLPTSLLVGAITNDNRDETIFLTEVAIAASIISLNLFYIIWRKDQILAQLKRVGVYAVNTPEEFTMVNKKSKRFMKFVHVFLIISLTGSLLAATLPLFGKERQLFIKIAFPFDWKNNEIAFWMANAFIFTEALLSLIGATFSVIIWYLLINCALRYETLGSQIRNMGAVRTTDKTDTANDRRILQVERESLFHRDLIAAIESHQHITDAIKELESFLSNMFFIKILTSGFSICASTYCLAFDLGENLVGRLIHLTTLLYNVSDIFMIMNFGNEITFSSDRLCYCLFESDWIDQPQATKKLVLVFGELIKQPHEIVIGKLYPLTLETFRRILNFAYDAFNILKNVK